MWHARKLWARTGSHSERDFCLWLEQQAALLRERRFDELDLPNLVEEIEGMARRDKRAVKSNLVVLLTHLLKHQFQPEQRSNGWPARALPKSSPYTFEQTLDPKFLPG